MSLFFNVFWRVFEKDLHIEWRSRQVFGAMLVFSLLAIFIFNFALDLEINLRVAVVGGILWSTLLFASTLGLNRAVAAEKERGGWDGLLLAPVDRSAVFFGKMASSCLTALIVAAILLPVISLLYNIPMLLPGVVLVVLLGSLGLSTVGTLLAAIAMQTRASELMLPILLFPISIPLVIAAVKATSAFQTTGLADAALWLNILWVFDVVFLVISWLVFDSVMEE